LSAERIGLGERRRHSMPLTGPLPEGRTFFCPNCGALYSVTHSQLSKSETVCLHVSVLRSHGRSMRRCSPRYLQ
jgi:hypothetical protein